MSLRAVIVAASTVVVFGLLALPAQAGEVPISPAAREQFRVGVALLRDPAGPRYEEAYRAFRAAYADSPSPKILGNLGLCAMNLERDSEAIEAYSRYLEQAPDLDAEERAQVEQDLNVLKASVVPVKLTVEPLDAVLVDERVAVKGTRVVNRYPAVDGKVETGIRAGHHLLRFEAPGHQTVSWELEAVRGQLHEKSVTLPPLAADADGQPTPGPGDEPERPIPLGVWIGLAATGACGIAFGVLGGLSLSNKSEFDDALAAGDTEQAQELRDKGTSLNIAADVMLGATVVAAGVTAVLFFTRPEVDETATEDTALRVAPAVGPGGGGLLLTGRF